MTDTPIAELTPIDQTRAERRRFLKLAGTAGVTAGGLSLLAACGGDDDPAATPTPSPSSTASPSPTPTPTAAFSEAVGLNFVLNLEYLNAQYLARAAFGTGLSAALTTGSGTQGSVTGGRQVAFADTGIAQIAREMANDDIAHVTWLRGVLGGAAVAQPAINIDGSASGAFTAAARAAGVVGANETFDPYASDDNFLLGAFYLKDVMVTAYRGIITALTTNATRVGGAGIHAIEAYHAGLIRTLLYTRGATTASLLSATTRFSNTRDQLDGGSIDLDQPITGPTPTETVLATSNIVPAGPDGVTFLRSPQQVLNIFYLAPPAAIATSATPATTAATKGGFFPDGVNGTLATAT